jgi:hypothetical protein
MDLININKRDGIVLLFMGSDDQRVMIHSSWQRTPTPPISLRPDWRRRTLVPTVYEWQEQKGRARQTPSVWNVENYIGTKKCSRVARNLWHLQAAKPLQYPDRMPPSTPGSTCAFVSYTKHCRESCRVKNRTTIAGNRGCGAQTKE